MSTGILTPEDVRVEKRSSIYTTGYERDVDPKVLSAAIQRLTYVDAYTKFQYVKPPAFGRNEGAALAWKRRRDAREKELKEGIIAEVYKSFPEPQRIPYGYEGDKKLLKQHIGYHAIQKVPKIIRAREKLVDKLKRNYADPNELSSLAESLAVVLTYRVGLPFLKTNETSGYDLSQVTTETIAYLEATPPPVDTYQELSHYYRSGNYVPGLWLISLLASAHDPRAPISGWHPWSEHVGSKDPYQSPFSERFVALRQVYQGRRKEELRKSIYKAHPICTVVDKFYKPFELANIVRLSDINGDNGRNAQLLGFINKIETLIKEANTELTQDFTIDWDDWNPGHYYYNWHKYRPLLAVASYSLHNGENEPISYLVQNALIPEMMTNTPTGFVENVLAAAGLLLSLSSLYTRGVAAPAISWASKILTGAGLAIASKKVYDAFLEAPQAQSRENIFKALDSEIVAYENSTSKSAAAGLFLIELLTSGVLTRRFKAPPSKVSAPTSSAGGGVAWLPELDAKGIGGTTRMLDRSADLSVARGADEWPLRGVSEPVDLSVSRPVSDVSMSRATSKAQTSATKLDVQAEPPSSSKATIPELDAINPAAHEVKPIRNTDRGVGSDTRLGNANPSNGAAGKPFKDPAELDALNQEVEALINPAPELETTALVPVRNTKTLNEIAEEAASVTNSNARSTAAANRIAAEAREAVADGVGAWQRDFVQPHPEFTQPATSAAPSSYKISYRDFDDLPRSAPDRFNKIGDIDTVIPDNTVLIIDGKHRVWKERLPTGELVIHQENIIRDSLGVRSGLEDRMFSAKEMGLPHLTGMQRAHAHGQSIGFESPYAIRFAPERVNQILQNNGIEEVMRALRDTAEPGEFFRVRTAVKTHSGTGQLKEISYHVEVVRAKPRARDLADPLPNSGRIYTDGELLEPDISNPLVIERTKRVDGYMKGERLFEYRIAVGKATPGSSNIEVVDGMVEGTVSAKASQYLDRFDLPSRIETRMTRHTAGPAFAEASNFDDILNRVHGKKLEALKSDPAFVKDYTIESLKSGGYKIRRKAGKANSNYQQLEVTLHDGEYVVLIKGYAP